MYNDEVKAYEKYPGESLMSRLSISAAFGKDSEKEIMIPNGEEVELLSDEAATIVQIQYKGNKWNIDARELRFSENNLPGTVDILSGIDFSPASWIVEGPDGHKFHMNTMEYNSTEWKLMHSLLFPIIIGLLIIAAMIIMMMTKAKPYSDKIVFIDRIAVWIVPLLVIVFSALELWYIFRMGSESYWWCSILYFSKWGAVLRWFIFAFVVLAQYYIIIKYHNHLNNVYRHTIIGGRIWMTVLTIISVIVVYFILLTVHPEYNVEDNKETMLEAQRKLLLCSVVVSNIFPVLYMILKTRSLAGVLVGPGVWFGGISTVVVSFMFVSVSWMMIKTILIPLISLVLVIVIASFLSRFKSVKTGTTTYTTTTTDSEGNKHTTMHTVDDYTTVYDDGKGKIKNRIF